MLRRAFLGTTLGLAALGRQAVAGTAEAGTPVDLLLVLAADVSSSMDQTALRLQREGYAAALRDPQVMEAIKGGPEGAIAMTYVEWSGHDDQRLLVPWTRVAEERDAHRYASAMLEAPTSGGNWTSISGALRFSRALLASAPFAAERMAIDVSGDGVNNSGAPVDAERDGAVEDGVTINGLPIIRTRSGYGFPSGHPLALDTYYRENVTGGFGSFVMPAEDMGSFANAIRRKLVLEIAGLRPGDVSLA